MNYEVTIGIPVYNAADYIRQAMDSALAQTYASIEYLLVDDGSKDVSLQIIQKYQRTHARGKDIRILCQAQNTGVGVARNRIIDEAQGRFLYFMDADDLIEPTTISLLMGYQQQTGADIVYGSYDKVETYHNNRIVATCQYPFLDMKGIGQLAAYAYRKYAGMQTTIWNFVVDIQLIRSARLRFLDVNFWEDMAFSFELVTLCRHAVLLPDITYHYLCHYDSLSNYQERDHIHKDEVLRNISTVDFMKQQCAKTMIKSYQPERCQQVLMTDFYMFCYILKNEHKIVPSFTKQELKAIMSHPVNLTAILRFSHGKVRHVIFWLLGKMPAVIIVVLVKTLGRLKHLI